MWNFRFLIYLHSGCTITGTPIEQICRGIWKNPSNISWTGPTKIYLHTHMTLCTYDYLCYIYLCLSLNFIYDDVSDVGLDCSDRRGSVRRASVALIWIICLVQHRRFFRGAVFRGFIHVCAPRQLPALMVGGLMSTSCISAMRCGKSFHDALLWQ